MFLFCAIATLVWLGVALGMRPPRQLKSRLVKVNVKTPEEAHTLSQQLAEINGVIEAIVIAEDGVAYLKVDQKILDENALAAAV